MKNNSIKTKPILFNFLIILSLVSFFQISIFKYLNQSITSSSENLSGLPVLTILILVLVLNLLAITISILVSSLIAYFFGTIFDANATKKTFIYILSAANIIIYLINIPLSIFNFLNNDSTKIILLNNPLFIFLNPLIYISIYVLYKLLKQYTQLSQRVLIVYCVCFYLLKIAGIIVSQLQEL